MRFRMACVFAHAALLLTVLIIPQPGVAANATDYGLKPQRIAPDVYVFVGANEDFSLANGGNILNTGAIVTDAGVIVINTGPSRLYGEQLRRAIGRITDKPVIRVYISKLHPDHFLGDQAFRDVPIYASPRTIQLLGEQAEDLTDNMYRLVGPWMRGTEAVIPNHEAKDGVERIGGHDIEVLNLAGHTPGDLVLLDRTRRVLFSGGVVFNQRAPTTPHADLQQWRDELQRLSQLNFDLLVPSHGPVAHDKLPIAQTADYLAWLDTSFSRAAGHGMGMAEVLDLAMPERFRHLAVMPDEYQRSVSHLYGGYEERTLRAAERAGGD